jgi:hypothetical protein
MRTPWMLLFGGVLTLCLGCDGQPDDDDVSAETGDTGEACEAPEPVVLDPLDAQCEPLSTDYRPSASSTSAWPACVTDDGEYHLFGTSPGSIARIEAYEEVRAALFSPGVPTPADFTRARVAYSQEEGLESRVVRREDLHYPEIPMSDWEAGVDPDKQCTVAANVEKYPDRCVGPARMGPLLTAAFAAGQEGQGNPQVHAARIDAGLLWFLLISTYKEAFTCTFKGNDCDSAWAYYTGGTNRQGGIGLAAQVRPLDLSAHDAIWDAVLAARCWRDVYPIETYPTLEDAPTDARALFAQGWQQLDDALWHGYALIVRDRLERQLNVCGPEAEANHAWLQVSGPVLAFEARNRDAGQTATLEAAWADALPTEDQAKAAVAALDALFPCPQPLD